jgi:hypothetical protein
MLTGKIILIMPRKMADVCDIKGRFPENRNSPELFKT